jgi:DNA recombination protein RmuC
MTVLAWLAWGAFCVAAGWWWSRRGLTGDDGISAVMRQGQAQQQEELFRVRGALDAAIRQSMALQGQVQRDAAVQVTEALMRVRSDLGEVLTGRLHDGLRSVEGSLTVMQERQSQSLLQLGERVVAQLREMQKDNALALEVMRATVDEKLTGTLQARLGESFRLVGAQLEQVHQGLGEVRALADGVGDLRKVLLNVKTRGALGEAQLEALLTQVLPLQQLERNVATIPGSADRVEFAVRLPAADGRGFVLLPVDAKFPTEDHARLLDALDEGDAAGAAEARKALKRRVLLEAEAIHRKYVRPPHTTDFAILFVPTEGLFAELVRTPAVVEEMQQRWRVMLAGPTTLCALLASVNMGLRTWALERRSTEVWEVLGAVKAEFGRFGEALDAVKRKLTEAASRLDETQTRSRVLQRRLSDVEEGPVSLP